MTLYVCMCVCVCVCVFMRAQQTSWNSADCELSLLPTLLNGAMLHSAWAVLFYLYVFVLRDNLVENFAYMIKEEGSLVCRVCSPFEHHLVQKAMYMLLHFSLSLLFALPGTLFLRYFWAGSAAIFAMMLVCDAAGVPPT